MSPEELDQIERDIAYLRAGAESVGRAEETLLRIARPMFESNGFAVTASGIGPDAGIDFAARDQQGQSVGVIVKCTVHRLGVPEIRAVIAAAEAREYSQYLLITNSALRPDAVEFARQAAHRAVNVVTIDQIRGWVAGIRARISKPAGAVAALVSDLSRRLIRLVAHDPRTLAEIEWRDLERTLAEAFSGLGFRVTLTPPAKDGGKDIILECMELGSLKTYVVEIKHWVSGKAVGKRHVQKFVSVILNERHASGLFLSTSGFAGNAFEALSQSEVRPLRIAGADKMVAVCETFVKAETGLWARDQELSELLFEGTERP